MDKLDIALLKIDEIKAISRSIRLNLWIIGFILTLIIFFGSCLFAHADFINVPRYRVTSASNTRFSTMQAFVYQAPAVVTFLNAPAQVYVQGCMLFSTNFPSDAFAVLDESFLDGTTNPLYNAQGNWDALIELQQNGNLWTASGPTPTTSPTVATFQITYLGAPFQKGQWYLVRGIMNVNTRKFVSLQVKGPGINSTTDLSAYNVNWVSNFNVNNRAMTFSVGAYRSAAYQASAGNPDMSPVVFWDNVSGGIPGSPDQVLFRNAFDNQTGPLLSPFATLAGNAALTLATDSLWYNPATMSHSSIIASPVALSPPNVGSADATLSN